MFISLQIYIYIYTCTNAYGCKRENTSDYAQLWLSIGFALAAARTFEADLRDELQRLGPPPVVTSGATGTPSTGEGPPPSQPSKEEVEPKEDKEENKKEGRLNLTPKGAPPAPPKQLIKAEEFQPPKEEKEPEKETRESRTEEEKPRAASSGRNRRGESKERRRGEDRFPRRERSRSRRRGSRSHRRERRSRDRDRKRRKELDSEEERPEGGKEKKRRSEKPPESPGPPLIVGRTVTGTPGNLITLHPQDRARGGGGCCRWAITRQVDLVHK